MSRRKKLGRRATYRETAQLRRAVRLQREALHQIKYNGGHEIFSGTDAGQMRAAVLAVARIDHVCMIRGYQQSPVLSVTAVKVDL